MPSGSSYRSPRTFAAGALAIVLAVALLMLVLDGGRPAAAADTCQYSPYGPYGQEPCEQVTPSIVPSSSPTTAEVGTTLQSFALLSGGDLPTGIVEFRLYGPGDPTCANAPVHVEQGGIANGGAGTTAGFVADVTGTWRWTTHYGGDVTNTSADSGCGAASTNVVAKAKPPTGKPGGEPFETSWFNCVADRNIGVPYGSRLVVRIGYAALEKRQVRDFLQAVVTEAWIDGAVVRNANGYWSAIEWDAVNSWWVTRWVFDTRRVMDAGTPAYTIAFRETLTREVFDGVDPYGPGVVLEFPTCLVSGYEPPPQP